MALVVGSGGRVVSEINYTAILLALLGVWLVIHTVAGDLPGRLASWADS